MEFVENPAGWEIVIEDITKRKVAEIELIQSEQKYRALVEQVSEAFVTVDLKGTIKSYKKTVRDLTDFTEDDIINHNIREFILPESSIDNPVFLFNTQVPYGSPEKPCPDTMPNEKQKRRLPVVRTDHFPGCRYTKQAPGYFYCNA